MASGVEKPAKKPAKSEVKRYVEARRARCFEYRNPNRRDAKRIIAVDIETDGLGGQFLLGAYQREDESEVIYFTTLDEWVEEVVSKRSNNAIWYAHNGGEYDFKYLLAPMEAMTRRHNNMTVQPIRQGDSGRVIGFKIRYRKNVYELRDSFALVNSSLLNMTRTLAPQYTKLDIGLKDGVTFDPANSDHRAYLEMDVRGLLASLITFRNLMLSEFDITLGWTIGSCAIRVLQKMLDPEQRYWRANPKVEAFIRRCYYGGYVFLRTTETIEDAASVDVNSMYPSVMRDYGVPVGAAIRVYREHPDKPGFYHVIAHVPDNGRMTCVPARSASGTVWPVGDFETWLYYGDMALGRAMGATFEVLDGYIFEEIGHPFDDFINLCERVRLEQKGTAMEMVVKLLQNSAYGKFGAKEETTVYTLSDEALPAPFTPVTDPVTGMPSDLLYTRQETISQPYMHIEWAAAITSNARTRLFSYIRAIGEEQVVYGDTDSITAHRSAIMTAIERGEMGVGNAYGLVKLEHEYVQFRAGGPKNYQGVMSNGQIVDKAKGIPRRSIVPEEHARALNGEQIVVTFTSMNGTMTMLKDSRKAMAETRSRTYSLLVNSASWWADANGRVHPVRATISNEGSVSYGKS